MHVTVSDLCDCVCTSSTHEVYVLGPNAQSQSGFAAGDEGLREALSEAWVWQVEWATLWAEVAPAPGLQGSELEPPAFCPPLSASPGKPSWPSCICSTFIPCASCDPCLSAQGHGHVGVGWGAAKDTGSALWGPVGQARVGSHPGRKGHSEVG